MDAPWRRDLDERADGGSACLDDQVSLPVPRGSAIGSLSWPLPDHLVCGDMAVWFVPRPRPWFPQRPARAQARHELSSKRPTPVSAGVDCVLDARRLPGRRLPGRSPTPPRESWPPRLALTAPHTVVPYRPPARRRSQFRAKGAYPFPLARLCGTQSSSQLAWSLRPPFDHAVTWSASISLSL